MTIKISRAAGNQYVKAVDHNSFVYPDSDWALAFVLKYDGTTSGDNPQYIVSNGTFGAAGSIQVVYQTMGNPTSPGRMMLYAGTTTNAPLLNGSSSTSTGEYVYVFQRSAGILTLRRCAILQAYPADGASVVLEGSVAITGVFNGLSDFHIGARADTPTNRMLDQSIGRVFRLNGTLTDHEVARLAYGEDIIEGLERSPEFYVKLDTISDIADRGPYANTFTVSGAPVTSPTQPAFGFTGEPASAPTISANPEITGTPREGSAVSFTIGTVTGYPTPTRAQQWFINAVAITGATGPTYTPVASDVGKSLTVRHTETNSEGTVSRTSAGVTVLASIGTIDVVQIPARKHFQQIDGASAVALSGTYTGTAPTSIEFGLYAADGTTLITPFTPINSAVISGGNWSGSALMPAGPTKKRLCVRSKDSGGSVVATSNVKANLFGISDLGAWIGSSAWEKMFQNFSGTGFTASANVDKHDGTFAAFGTDGAAILVANSLSTQGNISMCMLDYGVGGTTLMQWLDKTHATWVAFAAAVADVGGKLAFVTVSVGSNDAAFGQVVSQAAHEANLRQLVTNIRELTGQPDLKIFLGGFNRRTSFNTSLTNTAEFNIQSDYVRMAENEVGKDLNVFHTQSMHYPLVDNIHMTAAGYTSYASQLNYVWGNALYNNLYVQGPREESITFSGSEFLVNLEHRNGTDFSPASAITGYTASDDTGTLTITSVVRVNPLQIKVTVNRAIGANPRLKYMSGGGGQSNVMDNGMTALPMHAETAMLPQNITRTVSVNIGADLGGANLTGLDVSFYNGTVTGALGTLLFSSLTETTDAAGLLTFSFQSPDITAGSQGMLLVLAPNGDNYVGLEVAA